MIVHTAKINLFKNKFILHNSFSFNKFFTRQVKLLDWLIDLSQLIDLINWIR